MNADDLINSNLITEHHAETFVKIQKNCDKQTLQEFLSIFTKPAQKRIKNLAQKLKKKV